MAGWTRSIIRGALIAFTLSGGAALAEGIELLMFQQPGCIWCAQWNAEIAPVYDRTDEGSAAPLRRVELNDPLPEDIEIDRPVTFTPTFVLVLDGVEQARIEGYPGEDFFWPLLQRMIDNAATEQERGPTADEVL